MIEDEFKGRLKQIMEKHEKITWLKIGQYVLGALISLSVIALMLMLFLMDG